jgi:hypothetical protein
MRRTDDEPRNGVNAQEAGSRKTLGKPKVKFDRDFCSDGAVTTMRGRD